MANILVIDDNREWLGLATRFLAAVGHTATPTGNGREAMRAIEAAQTAQTGSFDLVITDLIMPEQEGLETIVALRRKYPAIKIIAMSGGGRSGPEDNLRIAKKLGAMKTLAKPFSGTELLAAVTEVLGCQAGIVHDTSTRQNDCNS